MNSFRIALVWIRLNLLGSFLLFLLFAGTLLSTAMVSERYSSTYAALVLAEDEKIDRATALINRTAFFLQGNPEPVFGNGLDRLVSYLSGISEVSEIETQLVSIHPYLFFHGFVRKDNGTNMKLDFLVMDTPDFADFAKSVGVQPVGNEPIGIEFGGSFNFLNEEGDVFREMQVPVNVSKVDLEKREVGQKIDNAGIVISRSYALSFFENYTGTIDFHGYVFMDYNLSTIPRSRLDTEIRHFEKFSNVDFSIQIGGQDLFKGKTTEAYETALKDIRSQISQLEVGGFLLLLPLAIGLFFLYLASFWEMIDTVRQEVQKLKKSGVSPKRLLAGIGCHYGLIMIPQVLISGIYRSGMGFAAVFAAIQFLVASYATMEDFRIRQGSSGFHQGWISAIKGFFGISIALFLLTRFLGLFFENFEKFNPLVGNSVFFISFLQIGFKVGSYVTLVSGIGVLTGYLLFKGSVATTRFPKERIRARYISFSIFGSRWAVFFIGIFIIPNSLLLVQATSVDAYYSDQAIMRVGADYMWTPWTTNHEIAEIVPEGNYVRVAIYNVLSLNFRTIEMMVVYDTTAIPNVMRFPQQMGLNVEDTAQQLSEGKILVSEEFESYVGSTGKFIVQFQYNETIPNSFIIREIDVGEVFTYFPTFRHLEKKGGSSMIVSGKVFEDMVISDGIIHSKLTEYVLLNRKAHSALIQSDLEEKGRLESFEEEKNKMIPLFLLQVLQFRSILIAFVLVAVAVVSVGNLMSLRTRIYDYAKLKILKLFGNRAIMLDLGGTWLALSNFVLLASFLSVTMLQPDFDLILVEYTLPGSQIDLLARTAIVNFFGFLGLLINLIAVGKVMALEYQLKRISNLREDLR